MFWFYFLVSLLQNLLPPLLFRRADEGRLHLSLLETIYIVVTGGNFLESKSVRRNWKDKEMERGEWENQMEMKEIRSGQEGEKRGKTHK